MKLALFGGLYSNYLALEAAIGDARCRGVDAMYCLGDVGAFGPHPDRVFPVLRRHEILCVQGNYDDSIGNEFYYNIKTGATRWKLNSELQFRFLCRCWMCAFFSLCFYTYFQI